jgi:selenocysteine-specific translation elongation factor
MGNLIVAVLGAPGYSGNIGKKGTSTDITLYDLKRGEDIVTLVEATKYPERLAPLFFAVSMAEKAIVVVDEITAAFGESVMMVQSSGIKTGYIVLRNFLTREKIEPLIKGTRLENFEYMKDNPLALRERLLGDASERKPAAASVDSPGTVSVDHYFNVKGVGTVVLGVVKDGIIRKHEAVRVLPGGKTAQIRSIQKHDDEFEQASEGDRVGIALKNIEVEDLDRGYALTTDTSIKSIKAMKTKADLVKYWPSPLKAGMVLHVGHWMQFISARVESEKDEGEWRRPILELSLEKELVYLQGDRAMVTYLDGGKLRVAGTIELPS